METINLLHTKEFHNLKTEQFQKIVNSDSIVIERIVSPNFDKPIDDWYQQDWDEYVLLIKGLAEIEYDDKSIKQLQEGDFLFIPSGEKHRVIKTIGNPLCIWLAIHLKPKHEIS